MNMSVATLVDKLHEGKTMTAAPPESSRNSFGKGHDYIAAHIEVKKMLQQVESVSPISQSGLMKKKLRIGWLPEVRKMPSLQIFIAPVESITKDV